MTQIAARRTGFGARFRLTGLALLVAVAVVAIVFAVRAADGQRNLEDTGRSALELSQATALGQPSLGDLTSGWKAWADPRLSSSGTPLLVVLGTREEATVLLFDSLGQFDVVGAVAVADEKPFVAFRPADRTLLVSDVFSLDGRVARARLVAFDLAQGLAAKYVIELPDRLGYTLYRSDAMQLSRDETVLYYPALRREPIRECEETADAATCDRVLIGIVDLQREAVLGFFDLGVGCGTPLLSPSGSRSAIATCIGTGQSYVVQPDGTASSLTPTVPHRYERPGVHGLPILTAVTAAGEPLQISDRGTGWIGQPDHTVRLIDTPERLNSFHVHQISAQRWLFGVMDASGSAVLTAALVWDPADPSAERRIALRGRALGVSPVGADKMAVLYDDGRLEIVDLVSGDVLRTTSLPSNVKGLAQ